MIRIWAAALVLAVTALLPAPCAAAGSAVVVMYHRFGEDKFPSTNIRLEQFEAHLEELRTGGFNVLPVPAIVDAIRKGDALPDRAVGITIDDGYLSIYTEAWPRLKQAGFPFTVFIATAPVDSRLSGFMSWDQIRELRDGGVTIGAHTATHNHMPEHDDARNERELTVSNRRFEAELGTVPALFAYPFGEGGTRVEKLVRAAGYRAAFGQQSGAVHGSQNRFRLPRFALNERYGEMSRFRLLINSLPVPVADFTPGDTVIGKNNPPAVGFTVAEGLGPLSRLGCFASTEGRLDIQRLGPRRVELRLARPLPGGRSRINCTMPADQGRWRWLGIQFVVPRR